MRRIAFWLLVLLTLTLGCTGCRLNSGTTRTFGNDSILIP